jgi:catechol 2,3-dioxygenase-like lactoylglutathione lyase family enzyme
MLRSPPPQRIKDRAEAVPVGGQPILHARMRRRQRPARNESVRLHLTELFSQHLGGETWHSPAQLAEPVRPPRETLKDHRLPAALDDANRRVERTRRALSMAAVHRVFALREYFEVPSCEPVAAGARVDRMAAPRLYRVIVPVNDLTAAVPFYASLFEDGGFRVSGGRHYFSCGDVILALYDPKRDGDDRTPRPNFEHVYFAVDDLEAVHQRARQLGALSTETGDGALPMGEIARRPWGERSFYAADPFGNPLCFVDAGSLFTGPRP